MRCREHCCTAIVHKVKAGLQQYKSPLACVRADAVKDIAQLCSACTEQPGVEQDALRQALQQEDLGLQILTTLIERLARFVGSRSSEDSKATPRDLSAADVQLSAHVLSGVLTVLPESHTEALDLAALRPGNVRLRLSIEHLCISWSDAHVVVARTYPLSLRQAAVESATA
jgi:hypothetical protein